MSEPAPTAEDMARDLVGDYAQVCGTPGDYARWLEAVDAGYPAALRRGVAAEADRARLVADIADMRRRGLDLFPPEQWGSGASPVEVTPDLYRGRGVDALPRPGGGSVSEPAPDRLAEIRKLYGLALDGAPVMRWRYFDREDVGVLLARIDELEAEAESAALRSRVAEDGRCPAHPGGERCALPAGHEGGHKWGRGD